MTIAEYEKLTGIPNRTIRNRIASGELPSSREKINNRRLTVIHLDDEEYKKYLASQTNRQQEKEASNNNSGDSPEIGHEVLNGEGYQEAVIINDSEDYKPQYNLVSMENEIFENLIQNIKDLADDRHETEKVAYKKLEEQFFKASQEASQWRDKAEEYRIESVQAIADKKINELRIKELEEKNQKLEDKIQNLEKQLKKSRNLWSIFNRDLY